MGRRVDTSGVPPWGRRPPDPSLRIGDTERNQVAEALSQHFSDGRLDQTELKDRLDKAMTAKTDADLSGLLTDLPPLPGQEASAPMPRHRRGAAAWLVLAIVFLALVTLPWQAGPWMPWMWFPRVPWILFGILAFVLWRRSRRRRWRGEAMS
jgi:hypothetical protein